MMGMYASIKMVVVIISIIFVSKLFYITIPKGGCKRTNEMLCL